MTEPQTSVIVDPSGKPARTSADARCPRCGAGPERRVLTSGFGPANVACGQCGHDVEEPDR